MDIPREAVDAAARALHADNCVTDLGPDGSCYCEPWDREARTALVAAYPHIGKKHIEEIRTIADQVSLVDFEDRHEGYYRGLRVGLEHAIRMIEDITGIAIPASVVEDGARV